MDFHLLILPQTAVFCFRYPEGLLAWQRKVRSFCKK